MAVWLHLTKKASVKVAARKNPSCAGLWGKHITPPTPPKGVHRTHMCRYRSLIYSRHINTLGNRCHFKCGNKKLDGGGGGVSVEGNSSEQQVGNDISRNSSNSVNDCQMINSDSLTCLNVIGDRVNRLILLCLNWLDAPLTLQWGI